MPNFLKKIANSNKGDLLNTILKKEKDKNPQKQLNEEEISNLLEK